MSELTNVITKIRKRDGRIVDFDPERITIAAGKALKAAGTANNKLASTICHDVIHELVEKKFDQDNIPDIEDVQDLVESAFIRRGLTKAAKLYILYRANREKVRTGKQLMMDIQELVSSYIEQQDWRVNENSNSGYSYASLLNHVSGTVVANYTLSNIYPEEISQAHVSGDFHLHDLSCGIVGYCAGWSLRQLLQMGFVGCGGRASAAPAKHFDTALGQIVNFLSTLQTEWAGAQAFNSFDTLLAPFVRHDQLSYTQIKQAMQQFVFGLNIASRWGQTPFTNLTFDWVVPEDLADQAVIIGGQVVDGEYYRDFQTEMDLINRAFLEVMSVGDRDGRIFTFPIPTYNITRNFNWDSSNAKLLFKVTGKYGLPYFQNFINSDLNPGDVRSMCCRLQMDIRELRKKTGGLFGAGEQTGSIGVVTINMPRLGYLSKDENEFFARLDNLMTMAMESLEIKRKVVQRHLDGNLLPYTKTYLGTLKNHFSTIGLVGMNEACLNFLGCSICDPDGSEFAMRILEHMKERIQDFQER
ncbi:MAG: ribonucleoside triphosphate reductase, partial [Victivallaceae bacterium]